MSGTKCPTVSRGTSKSGSNRNVRMKFVLAFLITFNSDVTFTQYYPFDTLQECNAAGEAENMLLNSLKSTELVEVESWTWKCDASN